MKSVVDIITNIGRQKDLLLIIVFATILLMMILPLPTIMMDLFITLNISAAIMILLMSLQLHSPVHFSTFPSLLLVTTLFRLAISISTTRLILVEGDAGKIVETFGQVVVGGNLVVGMVIFLIITVVQFLVITKGADRVAEVGARFTLDGMPGKQMSVDADVRAGTMDQIDAKEARTLLEREAKLFGAMDGAMKFVKGDATAGLVITAINLLGGIAIGMSQLGLGFSEALGIYALMTIGDGLVSQIPALLISVAAGTMVTRVTNPKGVDLGSEISEQITANSRTVMIAGVVIALFGFIPGFPTAIFVAVGLGMAVGVFLKGRNQSKEADLVYESWVALQTKNDEMCDDIQRRTGRSETLRIVLPRNFLTLNPESFYFLFNDIKGQMEAAFGVPMGFWRYEVSEDEEESYEIYVENEMVGKGTAHVDAVFVKANASYLSALEIPYKVHYGTSEGALIDEKYIQRLDEEKIQYWATMDQVLMNIKKTLAVNIHLLAGFQNTANMLDRVSVSNPALIADLRENLSNNQISSVIKLLLQERIPVTSLVRILESVLEWAPKRPDPFHVLQQVRIAIGDFITTRFAPDGFLPVVIMAPTLESFIREGFRQSGDESFLVLDSKISAEIAKQTKTITADLFKRGKDPVLLTQQDIRRALHNLLHEHGIYIPVLAYQEILPKTIIYPIGFIGTADEKSFA